ncbi:MAG: hypothetical protein ABIZ04_23870 [Opitutus sp.]
MKSFLRLVFLSVLAAVPSLFAQTTTTETPSVLKLGVGFDYSSGKYGFSQSTEVFSVPLNLSLDRDRWTFKATLPYITIKGPASVVTGTGAASGAPARPTTHSESGIGDAMLSATFHARPVPGELNVDVTGRVKFGTADEGKGLGTGETDYYTQVDLYQNFGTITPFATLGYRFLGTSTVFPLKDGLYASAGAAFRVSEKTVVGAAYDWRSRIIDGASNGTDGIAFVSTSPNERWNLLGYVIVGFNEASPDYGVGGLVTYKF